MELGIAKDVKISIRNSPIKKTKKVLSIVDKSIYTYININ